MALLRRSLLLGALVLGALGALAFLREGGPPSAPPVVEEPVVVQPYPAPGSPRGRRPATLAAEPVSPERRAAVARNNEAAELLQADELERAAALFEECHAAFPDEDVFRRNLAEALARLARRRYDERELADAVSTLERVLGLAPEREDAGALREILARWRKEAELAAEETTDSSRYFELSYDARREDVLHRSGEVIAALERAYGELRDWFQADPIVAGGRPPIRVVLYEPEAFDELTGLGDWAGGAFDGVVRISVADLERESARWRRVARHELAHAFLQEIGGGRVPGWLNEGLAQYLEGGDRAAALARSRALLAGGELFGLERLRGSLASWESSEEIARAYAQSLVLVDHVAREYGELVLRRMVEGCGEGREPAASFQAATGVPLDFVAADLRNYLR